LLVKRTNPPSVGSWSLPAGFLEVDERPEEAAARELTEETGLSISTANLELFETNLIAHPDGRYVLVIIYRTERTATDGTIVAGSDAADARFWTLSELSDSDESIESSYEPIIRDAVGTDQESISSS
jgi:ADP-ribose pyrophosphatase YjhB (NUDIX family)